MEYGLKILRFMFKTYSSSSSLVITSRWFATSRLRAPASVRPVYYLGCPLRHLKAFPILPWINCLSDTTDWSDRRAQINSWIELELIINSIQFSMNWIGIELKRFWIRIELELKAWTDRNWSIQSIHFQFNSSFYKVKHFFVCHIMEIVVTSNPM